MKKIISFSSFVSYGRCSLSVMLPIFSHLKIQCLPVVTTILPTHTGGFTNISKFTIDELIENTLISFKSNSIKADCIYIGYISNINQFKQIKNFLNYYNNSLFVMDPCFADNKKIYSGFDDEIIKEIYNLSKIADILFLNLTEAFYLLNLPFDDKINEEKINYIINEFLKFKSRKIFITSVKINDDYYNFYYDNEEKKLKKYKFNHTNENYPGTGDIFCSIVVSYILNCFDAYKAMVIATDFISSVIQDCFEDVKCGIPFEQKLNLLK